MSSRQSARRRLAQLQEESPSCADENNDSSTKDDDDDDDDDSQQEEQDEETPKESSQLLLHDLPKIHSLVQVHSATADADDEDDDVVLHLGRGENWLRFVKQQHHGGDDDDDDAEQASLFPSILQFNRMGEIDAPSANVFLSLDITRDSQMIVKDWRDPQDDDDDDDDEASREDDDDNNNNETLTNSIQVWTSRNTRHWMIQKDPLPRREAVLLSPGDWLCVGGARNQGAASLVWKYTSETSIEMTGGDSQLYDYSQTQTSTQAEMMTQDTFINMFRNRPRDKENKMNNAANQSQDLNGMILEEELGGESSLLQRNALNGGYLTQPPCSPPATAAGSTHDVLDFEKTTKKDNRRGNGATRSMQESTQQLNPLPPTATAATGAAQHFATPLLEQAENTSMTMEQAKNTSVTINDKTFAHPRKISFVTQASSPPRDANVSAKDVTTLEEQTMDKTTAVSGHESWVTQQPSTLRQAAAGAKDVTAREDQMTETTTVNGNELSRPLRKSSMLTHPPSPPEASGEWQQVAALDWTTKKEKDDAELASVSKEASTKSPSSPTVGVDNETARDERAQSLLKRPLSPATSDFNDDNLVSAERDKTAKRPRSAGKDSLASDEMNVQLLQGETASDASALDALDFEKISKNENHWGNGVTCSFTPGSTQQSSPLPLTAVTATAATAQDVEATPVSGNESSVRPRETSWLTQQPSPLRQAATATAATAKDVEQTMEVTTAARGSDSSVRPRETSWLTQQPSPLRQAAAATAKDVEHTMEATAMSGNESSVRPRENSWLTQQPIPLQQAGSVQDVATLGRQKREATTAVNGNESSCHLWKSQEIVALDEKDDKESASVSKEASTKPATPPTVGIDNETGCNERAQTSLKRPLSPATQGCNSDNLVSVERDETAKQLRVAGKDSLVCDEVKDNADDSDDETVDPSVEEAEKQDVSGVDKHPPLPSFIANNHAGDDTVEPEPEDATVKHVFLQPTVETEPGLMREQNETPAGIESVSLHAETQAATSEPPTPPRTMVPSTNATPVSCKTIASERSESLLSPTYLVTDNQNQEEERQIEELPARASQEMEKSEQPLSACTEPEVNQKALAVTLTAKNGPLKASSWVLQANDKFCIGSKPSKPGYTPIAIPGEPSVDRNHALIEFASETYFTFPKHPYRRINVLDLNSTEGTYVSDRAVSSTTARAAFVGDVLRVGKISFVVSAVANEQNNAGTRATHCAASQEVLDKVEKQPAKQLARKKAPSKAAAETPEKARTTHQVQTRMAAPEMLADTPKGLASTGNSGPDKVEASSTKRSTRKKKAQQKPIETPRSTRMSRRAQTRNTHNKPDAVHVPMAGSIAILVSGIEVDKEIQDCAEKIGAKIIDDVTEAHSATHIILEKKMKFTTKVLIAMCKTKNVVSLDWLRKCGTESKVVACDDFLLLDKKVSENIELNLSHGCGILDGWEVFVWKGVAGKKCPNENELKLIVEAAGGIWLDKLPKKPDTKILCITGDRPTKVQRAVGHPKTMKWFLDKVKSQETITE